MREIYRDTCRKCGARRIDQQIGLEATPEAYIAKMVEVFREVKRVLRDDGVLALNVGDCYATPKAGHTMDSLPPALARPHRKHLAADMVGFVKRTPPGLKPKDLCMMPSRLALAFQADRWYIRSMMPWVKRSAMPESGASDGANVTFKLDKDGERVLCDCAGGCPKCYDGYCLKGCAADRPTSAIEYVFLLSKSKSYFWDAEAVRVKQVNIAACRSTTAPNARNATGTHYTDYEKHERYAEVPGGRNFRNTDLFFQSFKHPHGLICTRDKDGNLIELALDVNPEAFRLAHFATFPRKLVTPLIKAATSERGCCPECLTPWKRIMEKDRMRTEVVSATIKGQARADGEGHYRSNSIETGGVAGYVMQQTLGWQPGCGCTARKWSPGRIGEPNPIEPIPCTCFDPFCGSGTVGVVAKQLGLSFIGIELSIDYAAMAEQRIANPEPEPVLADVEGQMELFEEDWRDGDT